MDVCQCSVFASFFWFKNNSFLSSRPVFYLFVGLSVSLFIRLFVPVCVCLSLFLYPYLCLSVWVSLSFFILIYVCLCGCLSLSLSLSMSVYVGVSLFLYTYLCLPMWVSLSFFILISVCLCECLSLSLSLSLSSLSLLSLFSLSHSILPSQYDEIPAIISICIKGLKKKCFNPFLFFKRVVHCIHIVFSRALVRARLFLNVVPVRFYLPGAVASLKVKLSPKLDPAIVEPRVWS